MADDKQWREMTADPKFRRVLVTNGRSVIGQEAVAALKAAGAKTVFVGVAEPWRPFAGEKLLRSQDGSRSCRSTRPTRNRSRSCGRHRRQGRYPRQHDGICRAPAACSIARAPSIARDEIDQAYLGFIDLAQAFGPAMRMRGADGINNSAAWVNLLSVYALANWPAFGAYSASQAACLSLSHCLRAELRPGGVRVMNLFTGPVDDEWFQTVPPPKVAPRAIAQAIVAALRGGLEESMSAMSRRRSGSVSRPTESARTRARQVKRISTKPEDATMQCNDLLELAGAIASGAVRVVDLTLDAQSGFSGHRAAAGIRPVRAVPHRGNLALRRARPGLVLEQSHVRRAHRHAFRRADPLDHRQGPAEQRRRHDAAAATSSRRPASSTAPREAARGCRLPADRADRRGLGSRARPHPGAALGADAHRLVEAQRSGRATRICDEDGPHTPGPDASVVNLLVEERDVSASAPRRSAPMPGRPRISSRRFRAHTFCTARAATACNASPISTSCRRPAPIIVAAPLKIQTAPAARCACSRWSCV